MDYLSAEWLAAQFKELNITIGLDSELVFYSEDNNGRNKLVAPHDVNMPQDRLVDPKQKVESIGDFHGDGFAFEINTEPVALNPLAFRRQVFQFNYLTRVLQNQIDAHNLGYITSSFPTLYEISKGVFNKAPKEVRQLGCMPSLNIYDDPGDPSSLGDTVRTTGCHIHVSSPQLTVETAMASIKWMDAFVGFHDAYQLSRIGEINEDDRRRRTAYGRAGEFRLNKYNDGKIWGFEYRVLAGPSIISKHFSSPRMAAYTLLAVYHGINGANDFTKGIVDNAHLIRSAINNLDNDNMVLVLAKISQHYNHINKILPERLFNGVEWGGIDMAVPRHVARARANANPIRPAAPEVWR